MDRLSYQPVLFIIMRLIAAIVTLHTAAAPLPAVFNQVYSLV